MRAHPRSRGENASHAPHVTTGTGSSPLTRGKRVPRAPRDDGDGLIPAHAGKTHGLVTTAATWTAHPRSRGENLGDDALSATPTGSSPLTRGKLGHIGGSVLVAGLIPAHAGKTSISRTTRRRPRAHPRSRGENAREDAGIPWFKGSSPLTRGKPPASQTDWREWGLIPAHAGKTCRCRRDRRRIRAHPRSRGENTKLATRLEYTDGSSPLTRGKHFLTCAFIAQIGQILESLELCASSESYSSPEAYATDALQGRVRSIDLGLRSSRGAS